MTSLFSFNWGVSLLERVWEITVNPFVERQWSVSAPAAERWRGWIGGLTVDRDRFHDA